MRDLNSNAHEKKVRLNILIEPELYRAARARAAENYPNLTAFYQDAAARLLKELDRGKVSPVNAVSNFAHLPPIEARRFPSEINLNIFR